MTVLEEDVTTEQASAISLDDIRSLLAEEGYEVTLEESHLRVKDLDSGIVIRSVLEENILFNTVTLMTVDRGRITPEIAHRMLDGENGISTSFFQLYGGARTAITLNNFCKLQRLGADDSDDILSCLEFLEVDAYAARELLADLID